MKGFFNEKLIILIGFIMFLIVIYKFLYRFVDRYLNNEVKKIIDNMQEQQEILSNLNKEANQLKNEINSVKKKYDVQINQIKKDNKELIAQHKEVSIVSRDDEKKIKKYLDSRLNNEILKLQKFVVIDIVKDIESNAKNKKDDNIENRLNNLLKNYRICV